MESAPQTVRLGSEKKRRGFPLAGGIVGGAVVLVTALGIAAARQAGPEEIRLADGSTFTLEAVTFGTEPVMLGRGWQRLLHSVLPAQWKAKSGCREVRGTTENCLHIWASGNALNPGPTPLVAVVVDEQGNESTPCSPMSGLDGSALRVIAYPRRSNHLRLRLYSGSLEKHQVLGETDIPNPAETNHPIWSPTLLPTKAQVASLEGTLLSLEREVDVPNSSFRPGPGEVLWRARVRLRRNGKPNVQYTPRLSRLTDAAGGEYLAQHQEAKAVRPGETDLLFLAPRWGQEQALRLEFTLAAEEEGLFPPEWTVRVPGVPVPPAKGEVPVNRKVPLHGGEITVSRIFAPGVLFPKAALAVPMAEASRFMLDAVVDDQGRRVAIGRPRTKVRPGEALGLQELTIPPGARSLTLTLHPTTAPSVEFLAPLTSR